MHQVFTCQGLMSFFLTPAAPFHGTRGRRIPVPPGVPPANAKSNGIVPKAGHCRPERSVAFPHHRESSLYWVDEATAGAARPSRNFPPQNVGVPERSWIG